MSNGSSHSVMIVAGEASGDMHGAALARELKSRYGNASFFGMGGDAMKREGVELLAPLEPVVGLVEVIRHLGGIRRALNALKKAMSARLPDLVVLVDYPDFNLRLAAHAKRLGLKVMYYISPQVWAWRSGRVGKIAKLVDAMAVILPFERKIYERAGLRTEYVGHPLVSAIEKAQTDFDPEKAAREIGIDRSKSVLALLPGSRRGEIDRHLGIVGDIVRILRHRRPELQIVIPVASTLSTESRALINALASGGATIVEGRSWDLFQLANAAVVASGTSSLESALFGAPTVVYYRLSGLTYFIGRRLVSVKYASLVNIMLNRPVIPEFIQDEARPEAIADAALALLDDTGRRSTMLAGFDEARSMLGTHNAPSRAADLAAEVAKW
ncbi:MAG: lipid-A-disaccharide synthase [Nitrospirae bacterium]|nr:lipid-A-disaccharide synthase [Nitrospirota bacterium]